MLPGSSGGGQLGQEEKVERAGSWLPVSTRATALASGFCMSLSLIKR